MVLAEARHLDLPPGHRTTGGAMWTMYASTCPHCANLCEIEVGEPVAEEINHQCRYCRPRTLRRVEIAYSGTNIVR